MEILGRMFQDVETACHIKCDIDYHEVFGTMLDFCVQCSKVIYFVLFKLCYLINFYYTGNFKAVIFVIFLF